MTRIVGIVIFSLSLFVCRSIAYSVGRENCFDNYGKEGICVPLSNCKELSESTKSSDIVSLAEWNRIGALFRACSHISALGTMVCCFTELKPNKLEYYVPKTCGHPPEANDTFGWTVLIGTGHFYRRCIGTLINNAFVLTAAHCVMGVEPHEITLYFGKIPVRELPQCLKQDQCQTAMALNFTVHPEFRKNTKHLFNVAVIETNLNVEPTLGNYIYPICLPLNATEEDTDQAKRHISRPRIYNANNEIQEACGYSGAPIVVKDARRYYVVGVANHPVECDRNRVKRDATPIMEYVDWILSTLPHGKEEPTTIKP